jgi:hypothetical protein
MQSSIQHCFCVNGDLATFWRKNDVSSEARP